MLENPANGSRRAIRLAFKTSLLRTTTLYLSGSALLQITETSTTKLTTATRLYVTLQKRARDVGAGAGVEPPERPAEGLHASSCYNVS
eukprot:9316717-Pyramimonas_sp.AAC.1